MAIRLTNGAEFLHIPKTGGIWVEKALRECNLIDKLFGHRHANYYQVLNREINHASGRQLLGSALQLAVRKIQRKLKLYREKSAEQTYRFCFVRHPLSWYESWWKFMKGRGWNYWGKENSKKYWHPNAILNGLGDDDFNVFVRNVINKRPGYVTELYFSYTEPGINFIGKTENLVDDLIYVLRYQGLEFNEKKIRSIEKQNISTTDNSEIKWDPDLKRTVTILELPALIHFGYISENSQAELKIAERISPNKSVLGTKKQRFHATDLYVNSSP